MPTKYLFKEVVFITLQPFLPNCNLEYNKMNKQEKGSSPNNSKQTSVLNRKTKVTVYPVNLFRKTTSNNRHAIGLLCLSVQMNVIFRQPSSLKLKVKLLATSSS